MPVLEAPNLYPTGLKKAESVGATTLFMGHAFKGREGDLGPVARGSTVADVFRESLATHEAWNRAVRQALTELPNGTGGERAMRAVELLREEYALGDADGGYPSSGTTTIPAYLRLLMH
jgi:hypothetical protein